MKHSGIKFINFEKMKSFIPINSLARKSKSFIDTPIIAKNLRNHIDSPFRIHFKLENLQPSGSFKDRGISHMIHSILETKNISKLVTSSGGNAGNAVATCGERLGIPVDVFVPKTTLPMMVEILRSKGANVLISGENWNEADGEARKSLLIDPNSQYIPPFDHPLIWTGNSTLIDEFVSYFGIDTPPDDIVLSVGGGGLLRGIQEGLERIGGKWSGVRVIAVETEGACSFNLAKLEGKVIKLDKISTIATSLGALSVIPSVLSSPILTLPYLVSDKDTVEAITKFLNLQRILVEPACGAALATVLCENHINNNSSKGLWNSVTLKNQARPRQVVVVACGGSAVSLDLLLGWQKKFSVP